MIRGSKNTMSCTECILVSNMYLIIPQRIHVSRLSSFYVSFIDAREMQMPSRAIVKTLPIASAKRPKDLNDDPNAT